MSEPLIVCENLVKIHQADGIEVVALQGLDLTVEPGELLGIVGASGSGKTTLLNVLGGLDRPSAGRALVNNRDLLKLTDAELDAYRREHVGFVWQQTTRNLVPYLTALENVELPLMLIGCPRRERRERALALLESLGLADRLHYKPARLSGGEQQRVAIAVALANRPLILLADEPTGEVDTATAQDVYAAFRRANEVYGTTIIIVSHDPTIRHSVNRVVAIRDGKTSTETIRQATGAHGAGSGRSAASPAETHTTPQRFEELIVLDAAGRLQIPRHLVEALNIGDRVRLELTEGGLVLRPVTGRGLEAIRLNGTDMLLVGEELYLDEDAPPRSVAHSPIGRARQIVARIRFRLQKHLSKDQ